MVQMKFNFTIYPITFPKDNAKEWKKLFKPCASQRLFLPVGQCWFHHDMARYTFSNCHCVLTNGVLCVQLILKEVDSLLYVDTDIIFLQPVEEIWNLLSHFNSTHLAAMAPEHEEPRIGWYNRFARHPYYGKTGVNSGVMLMNMTRLREKYFEVCLWWSLPFAECKKVLTVCQKFVNIQKRKILECKCTFKTNQLRSLLSFFYIPTVDG